jgi:hypothetical protein
MGESMRLALHGVYESEIQEEAHVELAVASNHRHNSAEQNLLLPMTTTWIYGKLFPESRKCPSQNSQPSYQCD